MFDTEERDMLVGKSSCKAKCQTERISRLITSSTGEVGLHCLMRVEPYLKNIPYMKEGNSKIYPPLGKH